MNGIATLMKEQLALPKRLLTNYRQLGLTESDVMVLLHIHRFQTEGNDFPTPSELSEYLSINEYECSQVLRKLIQKGYLSIEQNTDEQVLNEVYSLNGLWEALVKEQKDLYQTKQDDPEQPNMFVLFEQEFGRALSPFEIETINIWIDEDQQEPALIKAALREAVLMGKLNFKYIDRILREWKKKGIRSVQDAREASKSFRSQQGKPNQNQSSEEQSTKRDVSIYYNWLDDDA